MKGTMGYFSLWAFLSAFVYPDAVYFTKINLCFSFFLMRLSQSDVCAKREHGVRKHLADLMFSFFIHGDLSTNINSENWPQTSPGILLLHHKAGCVNTNLSHLSQILKFGLINPDNVLRDGLSLVSFLHNQTQTIWSFLSQLWCISQAA